MTFSQLIEQTRIERDRALSHVERLDAALEALSKVAAVGPEKKGRVWTPEQRAQLSASLKRAYAAKRSAAARGKK